MVRRICDYAARHGQSFVLETGQEPADILLTFLRDVDRKNIGINFDPANMIMYGTGDPIQALSVLGPHVISVHCKDGVWPPKGVTNALGSERPLGEGEVGMPQFIAKLKQIGYKGILSIEREIEDQEQKNVDMRNGVKLLETLRDAQGP
jgi:sugar phosphate isomerase/epimerase